MRLRFTERADKDYAQLPLAVRKVFAKQIDLLLANFRHPSLRAKKFDRSAFRIPNEPPFLYHKRIPNPLRDVVSWQCTL
jgi:hypothetical protein